MFRQHGDTAQAQRGKIFKNIT